MRIVDESAAGGERGIHSPPRLVGRDEDVEVRPASRRSVAGDRIEGELRPAPQRIDGIRVAERLIPECGHEERSRVRLRMLGDVDADGLHERGIGGQPQLRGCARDTAAANSTAAAGIPSGLRYGMRTTTLWAQVDVGQDVRIARRRRSPER